jgi:hypothetical protein
MKKTTRKLTLNRETLRLLMERSLENAQGGFSTWSDCYCTNISACCSAPYHPACGTVECW